MFLQWKPERCNIIRSQEKCQEGLRSIHTRSNSCYHFKNTHHWLCSKCIIVSCKQLSTCALWEMHMKKMSYLFTWTENAFNVHVAGAAVYFYSHKLWAWSKKSMHTGNCSWHLITFPQSQTTVQRGSATQEADIYGPMCIITRKYCMWRYFLSLREHGACRKHHALVSVNKKEI